MQTMKTEFSEIQWLRGAVYGAIAYVTAILFTGVWFYFDHYETPIRALASNVERLGMGVATFYEGQFVVGDGQFLYVYGPGVRDMLFPILYRIIPVFVLLLIAGVFVYAEVDAKDRITAFLSGASLVSGYFVLFVVVVLVFRSLAGSDFLPIGMAIVSGILYPIVLGGVAGVAANELKGYVEGRTSAPGVEENM